MKMNYATLESMRRSCALFFVLTLLATCPALADDAGDTHPYVSALRSLSINHSLLTKAEEEYRGLQEKGTQGPSEETDKRSSDLRYKIQALNEDAQRLREALPADKRAEEFLTHLVHQKTGAKPVDPAAEKRFDDTMKAIYRLHEKALSHVAEHRFEQAERTYEEIVLLSPDDDEAYLLLGHTCLAAAHYEKAAAAFRSAMHIDPSNAREIPRLYENILVENPADDEAMTQLGYAYLLLGHAKKAHLSFNDALALNPHNQEARRGLLEIPQT